VIERTKNASFLVESWLLFLKSFYFLLTTFYFHFRRTSQISTFAVEA